jgi:hypothetical protein
MNGPTPTRNGRRHTERERLATAAGRREVKECYTTCSRLRKVSPTATLESPRALKVPATNRRRRTQLSQRNLTVLPGTSRERDPTRAPIEVDRVNGCIDAAQTTKRSIRVVARLRSVWQLEQKHTP